MFDKSEDDSPPSKSQVIIMKKQLPSFDPWVCPRRLALDQEAASG